MTPAQVLSLAQHWANGAGWALQFLPRTLATDVVTLPPALRPIAFVNSEGNGQVVTDDACPSCGYPERHRVYRGDSTELIADGCPSCEMSRMPGSGERESGS